MAKSKIEADMLTHLSLSPETMVIAVQAEKERRGAKGYSLYCFAVDGREKKSFPPIKTKLTELEFTLLALRSEFVKGNIKDGTRVQLLVKNGIHWTTADLEFTKEKGVSAFILDAAKDIRYIDTMLAVYKTFKKQPHELYVCAGGIQYDHKNCAVFSLHHAFKASKIGDLHRDLKARVGSFEEERDLDRIVHRVSHNQLPPSLLSTLQRPASVTDYLRMNPGVINEPITKKGSTLQQRVERNTEEINGRFTNTYVSRVRDKTLDKTRGYLAQIDEASLETLLNFRRRMIKEMKEITDPEMLLPPYHVRMASGQVSFEPLSTQLSEVGSEDEARKEQSMDEAQSAQLPIDEEPPFVARDLMIDKQRTMKEKLQSGREHLDSPDTTLDTEPTKVSTSRNDK